MFGDIYYYNAFNFQRSFFQIEKFQTCQVFENLTGLNMA